MAKNMEPLFKAIMGMPKPLVKETAPLQVRHGLDVALCAKLVQNGLGIPALFSSHVCSAITPGFTITGTTLSS